MKGRRMASWIKEVPLCDLIDGECYFLARKWTTGVGLHYLFLSRLANGRPRLSSKPGIAIRCVANDNLRQTLAEHEGYVAVEIPGDADKRWKARKSRR